MQSPCAISDLPPELLMEIFSILREDGLGSVQDLSSYNQDLSSCNQVSKTWYEVSLPQLYAVTTVVREHDFGDCVLFLHAHPHIARSIRALKLVGKTVKSTVFSYILWIPKLFCDALVGILSELTNLDLLQIDVVTVVEPTSTMALPSAKFILGTLRVRHVVITEVAGRSPLSMLLSALAPRTLDITNTNVMAYSFADDVPPGPSLEIRKLLLPCYPSNHTLLPYFRGILPADCVRYLSTSLAVYNLDIIKAFREFADSSCRSLTTLNVRCNFDFVDQYVGSQYGGLDTWTQFGNALAACDSLTTLRLMIPQYISTSVGEANSSMYTNIFSLAPRTLRNITLAFKNVHNTLSDPLELWDISAIDRPWFRGRFPALRRVCIKIAAGHIRDNSLCQTHEEHVLKALPALHEARLLRVKRMRREHT